MPRLLIVSDAWHPQVNGVVRSLDMLGRTLRANGFSVDYLTPEIFWTVPLPTYPEIRISLPSMRRLEDRIAHAAPDHIHIATEGPLGLAARTFCLKAGLAFTTSYHTRFPEYLAARLPVPMALSYGYLRWFHEPATTTMVPTPSVLGALGQRGFRHLAIWSRGVDLSAFSPGASQMFENLPGPLLLYVGRLAVEKNVAAFLDLDLPGSKIVVGDGPQARTLMTRYPDAFFMGRLQGTALRDAYRAADVLVFPSRTDTFGNVILEAMACGTPVAAFAVTGPLDIIADGRGGALSADDLRAAVRRSLDIPPQEAVARAKDFTWARAARQFVANLVPARDALDRVA